MQDRILLESNSLFHKKIIYREYGSCWYCISHRKSKGGRGQQQVKRNGKLWTLPRYSYFLDTGKEVPEGFKLIHTCGNSWCINPDHMEIVCKTGK